MKKSFLILLLPFLAFCQDEYIPLVDTNQLVTVQLGKYSGTSLTTSDFVTTLSDVPYRFFTQPVGVRFTSTDGYWSIAIPNLGQSGNLGVKPGALSYSGRPVQDNSNGLAYNYKYFPSLVALYRFIESAYIAGFRSAFEFTSTAPTSVYANVDVPTLIADCLSGTNGAFRSSVVDLLSSLKSSSLSSSSHLDDISNTLADFMTDYEKVNFFEFSTFQASVDFALNAGYISSSKAQELKDRYNSLAGNPSRNDFDLATRQFLNQAAKASNSLSSLLSNNQGIKELGEDFNEALVDHMNDGFNAAAHFHGATTNLLQRITNNTEQIKNDLHAWRTDATNRLERQWDGIKKIRDNTGDTAAGVSSIVNNGVKIQGPVQVVLGTDFLGIEINPGDLNQLIQGFASGADSAMKKWLDEWDLFKDSQLPYMSRFSSFIETNTNLLLSIDSKFDPSYTNVFNLIYNQLTNNVCTNNISALLLDDYQTFVDSSKYPSLVSSLPPDLSAALSSFGFADSSEYSGRWWVFQSANMALQSQLALTNAALSSTLLHALSAIDDSDSSGGSLLSRWLSLIDSIPDPEEIQRSLADATNIVSNIGFERVDTLYSMATQDLFSVVKGIYQDKSLPDKIRFVFIPAKDGHEEKFVDIPVGDHSSLWSLFRSGMAFALSVVTLLLFPKYVSWLVSRYTRLVERIIKSLHAYTHQ